LDAELLMKPLAKCTRLLVITERHPGCPAVERVLISPGAECEIFRILPRYSGNPGTGVCKAARLLLNRLSVLAVTFGLRPWRGVTIAHYHGQYARFGISYLLVPLTRMSGIKAVVDIKDLGARGKGLRYFDMVIVNSRNAIDAVKRHVMPERLRHIPVPHKRLRLALADRGDLPAQFFLFVGALSKSKGVDILLEAYRRYREEFCGKTPLLLIGPLVEPALAHDTLAMVLGDKPPEFVAAAMRESILVLLPSRSESMPHVCLEAIDAGTRFVVGPGIPEIEELCPGNVLPTLDVDAILRCLAHPETVPLPPQYDFAPHDPDAVGLQICDIYAALLNDPRTGELAEGRPPSSRNTITSN
jgi:glycosyltransferase involved in cell wall biosynthesis